jgi:flagellar hook protein FlgE
LQLATSDSAPQATTNTEFGINLPADAQPPPVAIFDPNNASTYNHSTAITIYDCLGATHTATAYFVKTATPNQWDARFYIDGTAVGGANTMTYSNAGALTAPATGAFTLPAYTPTTGAAPITLSANVLGSTQYGSRMTWVSRSTRR